VALEIDVVEGTILDGHEDIFEAKVLDICLLTLALDIALAFEHQNNT
jgi:hypothetical protein